MEKWKDIPGYEGLYQASTDGRIRTAEGKTTYTTRHGARRWKSRIMKGRGKQNSGYRVTLWKDGKKKEFLVARLVAVTFLKEPEEDETVNHKDGNRFNNFVDNLEWLPLADNIRHGFEHGLYTSQKPVQISDGENTMTFRSMAECDRFLGRPAGYTSWAAKENQTLKSSEGKQYHFKRRRNNGIY